MIYLGWSFKQRKKKIQITKAKNNVNSQGILWALRKI